MPYFTRDFDDIKIYYERTRKPDELDDVTWNDLEMNRIFEEVNATKSYVGEQVLYGRLHKRVGREEMEEMECHISFLEKNEKARCKIEEMLKKIGKKQTDYYLPEFLLGSECFQLKRIWPVRVLQILLAGSFFAGLFFGIPSAWLLFLLIAVVNLLIYMKYKVRYETWLCSLISTKQIVLFAKYILSKPELCKNLGAEKLDRAVRELNGLTRMIGLFQLKKAGMWTGEAFALFQDYLLGITLWDMSAFQRITKIISGRLDLVLKLYEFAGQIDTELSVMKFRENLPFWCVPEFAGDEAFRKKERSVRMEIRGMYHPVVQNPVENDLILSDNVILTGSNASGKSTFLKAAAVNMVLAGSIHTCTARCACILRAKVMSSMTVRDDVQAGESYYITELKYLKRILDEAQKGDGTVFCVIDEILRGTNTKERLEAAELVLRFLENKNCIVLAATHDLELAKRMQDSYQCMFFSNYVEKGQIVFDYRLREGISETTNAILLLKTMAPYIFVDHC